MYTDTPITIKVGEDEVSRCFALNANSKKFLPMEAADAMVKRTGEKI